jgi:hypothetical protein
VQHSVLDERSSVLFAECRTYFGTDPFMAELLDWDSVTYPQQVTLCLAPFHPHLLHITAHGKQTKTVLNN